MPISALFTPGQQVTAAMMNGLASPPSCRLTHSTTQSISNSVETALAYDTETYDTDNMHDPATNNSRITINTLGLYLFTVSFGYAANGTAERIWRIRYKGGLPFIGHEWDNNPSAGQDSYASVSGVYKCVVGDWFDTSAFQTSGVALNVQAARFFAATWIGLGV